MKRWSGKRHGKLQLDTNEMDEYVFYVNVGEGFADVMRGLAMANGGAVRNKTI